MNFFSEKLHRYIERHMSASCSSMRCAQEKILYGVLGVGAVVLLFPYLLGVVLAGQIGLWSVVMIDSLAYLWLLFLVCCRPLSYRARVYGLLFLIEFLALSLLAITGNQGAGWLWLFLAPVLATLLLDSRNGYLTATLSTVLVVFLGVGDRLFLPGLTPLLRDGLALFVVICSNYLALSLILVFIIGRLLGNLEGTLLALREGSRALELTQEAAVDTMASLAEYRDNETGNHIIRTRHYVHLLARSAPLHDIGKIGVPDEILLKPGRLTSEEFEEMKKHAEHGKDALMHAKAKLGDNHFLQLAAEIAWTHHEKWDGSGYPRGLSGEDIPLSGRIMAVADVYDALISRRVYKDASTHEQAMAYILDHSGSQFDPEVVRALQAVAEDFRTIARRFSDE